MQAIALGNHFPMQNLINAQKEESDAQQTSNKKYLTIARKNYISERVRNAPPA